MRMGRAFDEADGLMSRVREALYPSLMSTNVVVVVVVVVVGQTLVPDGDCTGNAGICLWPVDLCNLLLHRRCTDRFWTCTRTGV